MNESAKPAPTPQQAAILDKVKGTNDNIMVRARAGTGKTTMLEMIDAAQRSLPALLICFNKSIADEATRRMKATTTVRTFNSLGHRIWSDYCSKRLTLNKNKIRDIFKALVDEAPRNERKEMWSLYDQTTTAVNRARSVGYIPDRHAKGSKSLCSFRDVEKRLDETLLPGVQVLVDDILTTSISQAYEGVIDFTDQAYMPSLFGGNYPSFPLVMIDEYQDLSPVNRAMVAKLCRHSRQIGVGDEAQSIYEFRGADTAAMPDAVEQFSMEVMPLSVSFRCPSNITDNVRWRVPDIRASRDGGSVLRGSIHDIDLGSTVICRYNAPLIHTAMELLQRGVRVDVAGVDIGAKIIRLLGKLGDDSMAQSAVLHAIDDWQSERESLDSKTAADTAECMKVFARHGRTLAQAIAYAKHIFEATEGEIQFMSGHRSKGLEFDRVYHLDSETIRPGGQEDNIRYVIDTRTKDTLIYISSDRRH